ncbi:hypothetical protein U1Q18_052851 [Sarracenia purpurea var. burkii]
MRIGGGDPSSFRKEITYSYVSHHGRGLDGLGRVASYRHDSLDRFRLRRGLGRWRIDWGYHLSCHLCTMSFMFPCLGNMNQTLRTVLTGRT